MTGHPERGGGRTFGADVRWTENPRRQDDPTDPEGVEGNTALDVDLADDGRLVMAFTRTDATSITDVWTRTGDVADGAVTWDTAVQVAATGSWSYRPQLSLGDGVRVTWQEATEGNWHLARSSQDDAGTWSAPVQLTSSTRYAGWHALAGDHAIVTAETADGTFRTFTMSVG